MNPTPFHDHHQQQQHRHARKESNNNANICPPPLKVGKDSHLIKKASSSSSSSSAASSLGVIGAVKPQQQRHPVIIYTHSPKVIHTHPKDFMALVQKLTGLSRNEDHHHQNQNQNHIHNNNNHHHASHLQPKTENDGGGGGGAASSAAEEDGKRMLMNNDDNESSSVITDENCEGQVNSCFVSAPLFDPPAGPFLTNIPVFTPNSVDFLCVNHQQQQPYYNYTDSLFFTPNMRSSISSSSGLEGITEFRDY